MTHTKLFSMDSMHQTKVQTRTSITRPAHLAWPSQADRPASPRASVTLYRWFLDVNQFTLYYLATMLNFYALDWIILLMATFSCRAKLSKMHKSDDYDLGGNPGQAWIWWWVTTVAFHHVWKRSLNHGSNHIIVN